jgi:hypothetical protein
MVLPTAERTMAMICHNKAEQMWATFNDQERSLVRFGMFPAAKMREATDEGHDSRLLAVALMDQAKKNGGMIC